MEISGYVIEFDKHGSFSLFDSSGFGKSATIFGADMSLSVHIDNKKKDILILGKGSKHGLGETTLTAEKEYWINFTEQKKKICLNLHYNGVNSYTFVNVAETHKFKAKDSEINAAPLRLWNVSKDFSVDNMKKTGSNGHAYDFSVDYDVIFVDDVLDIHICLMKKTDIRVKWNEINKMFDLLKNVCCCNRIHWTKRL